MRKLRDAKLIFDPTLFWDAEDIDIGRHTDYIIARVLDFGDEKDVKRLREIYSDDKLINVIRTRRGLLPITKRFWSVYFNIPLREEGDVSGSTLRKSSGSDRQNHRSDQ
jgi:transcriptional regulator